ncbi:tRNA pseudouridine(13) synthase TruD [Opacimonas viscosa]
MSISPASLTSPLPFPLMDWAYWYGKPVSTAKFKQVLSDFKVVEDIGFSPSGEGEHIFLLIEKTQLNTAYVAEQLAAFTGLPLRNISYAGRKDKFSISTQWFGVHCPGKKSFAWDEFDLKGVVIKSVSRHDKKLKTGALKRNAFTIVLRDVSDISAVQQRLDNIATGGVPNYFGSQRFGEVRYLDEAGQQCTKFGGNLTLAENLYNGKGIKNRNKRSVAISALRSWLFNTYISEKIRQETFATVTSGDVCILSGSNSFFTADKADASIQQRLVDRDIVLSAPMWGAGELAANDDAAVFEQTLAAHYPEITNCLVDLGLKQERRAIHLWPENLVHRVIDTQHIEVSFGLPKGCFATSILREVVQFTTNDATDHCAVNQLPE